MSTNLPGIGHEHRGFTAMVTRRVALAAAMAVFASGVNCGPESDTSKSQRSTTQEAVATAAIRARMSDIEQRLQCKVDSFTGCPTFSHLDEARAMSDSVSFIPLLVWTDSLPGPSIQVACWYSGTKWLFMTDAYVLVGSRRFHRSWQEYGPDYRKGYLNGLVTEEAYFVPYDSLEQAIVEAAPETAIRVRFDGRLGRREFELSSTERRIWADCLYYRQHFEFR